MLKFQVMELFSDAGIYPLHGELDYFDLTHKQATSLEETLPGGVDSLFQGSYLGKYARQPRQLNKQDFILDINEGQMRDAQVFDVSKKIKKTRRKPDYKKNICGNITKRIIREFLSQKYSREVVTLCDTHQCHAEEVRAFFLSKIQTVTGPRHLEELIRPSNSFQTPLKSVFTEFFEWFLKERYIRYLLCDGKMSDKRAYVEYKNTAMVKYIKVSKRSNQERRDR